MKARSPLHEHDLGQSWMHTSVLCELRDREIDDDDVGPPLLHSLLSVVDETDSDGAYSEVILKHCRMGQEGASSYRSASCSDHACSRHT